MGVFEFVVAVTAVGCAVPITRAWFEHRERVLAAKAPPEALRARVAELEVRVRVLERIVTDRGYYVRDEIERLEREAPPG